MSLICRKICVYLPGIVITFFTALLSFFIGERIPLVGASIFALLMGILLNLLINEKSRFSTGLKFCSKTILKTAIILLGTGLSISQIMVIGKYSLYVMVFTLLSAFGSGYILGKLLKVNWKMSTLISAGTGICGGSAIAALSPTIEADESDIAYSIAATFIFDILMIILFPIIGRLLGLSDLAYGLWTGTAVNDTSSVVAAGYAFSNAAGEFATIVKLTRTLSIVPIVFLFSFLGTYKKQRELKESTNSYTSTGAVWNRWGYLMKIAPWFILLFVAVALINSLGYIPVEVSKSLKVVSKFLMAMALGAIGFNTDLHKVVKAGINPMILGFLVSAIVAVVSLLVQFSLGQI